MSKTLYHVNPETYEISVCSARVRCRFANDENVRHFSKENLDEARKYVEELGEKNYSSTTPVRRSLGQRTIDLPTSKYKDVPVSNNMSFEVLQEKQAEYFYNLSKKTPEEIADAQVQEVENILQRTLARGYYDKKIVKEAQEDLQKYADTDHPAYGALLSLRNNHTRQLKDEAYKMSDQDIVDMIRERDLVDKHIALDSDNLLMKENYSSHEKSLLEDMKEFSPEFMQEKLNLVTQHVINNTAIDKRDYLAKFPSVKVPVKKFLLKQALKDNNNVRTIDLMNELREVEKIHAEAHYVRESRWNEYEQPITNFIYEYNIFRKQQALKNLTEQ